MERLNQNLSELGRYIPVLALSMPEQSAAASEDYVETTVNTIKDIANEREILVVFDKALLHFGSKESNEQRYWTRFRFAEKLASKLPTNTKATEWQDLQPADTEDKLVVFIASQRTLDSKTTWPGIDRGYMASTLLDLGQDGKD